ncbi:MAG: hypothetical protein VXW58_10385, partial [Pseudomonadota bacterium]|nr:hypothetical protein [Pseudomonadota bacterium]
VLLRLEDVQARPEMMLDQIVRHLHLPDRNAAFRPVIKRLGSRFKAAVDARPARPDVFPDADRAFMWSQLDTATEAALGYLAR